jgi:hypothetical protein
MRDAPRSWLASAATGAAVMALPPLLMSTLSTPTASPMTLPAPTAPPLARPLPTSATSTPSPAPTPPVYTPPPDEGVEPSGSEPPDPPPASTEPEPTEPEPEPGLDLGLDVDITDANSCPSLLDATLPHVARAGWHLMNRFGIGPGQIIGRAPRSRASEHPLGLALDFTVDRRTGDRLVDYVLDNQDRLGVKYVIYRQRFNSGSGFRLMEDRGSATANHYDHVHVSFRGSNDEAAELAC